MSQAHVISFTDYGENNGARVIINKEGKIYIGIVSYQGNENTILFIDKIREDVLAKRIHNIEAIKRIRATEGCGLREAKEMVDQWLVDGDGYDK